MFLNSGPGIYAFKCSAAQTLFELLQAKIQGNPGTLPIIPLNPRLPVISSESAQANLSPLSLSPTFDYVNIMDAHDPLRNSAPNGLREGQEEHPLYINVDSAVGNAPYANLDSSALIKEWKTVPKVSSSNGRLRNGLPRPIRENSEVLYTNLASPPLLANPEVNYAELDLEQVESQGQSQPLPPPNTLTPPHTSPHLPSSRVVSRTTSVTSRTLTTETGGGELGYATIDFDRTAALSVVTRSKIKLDFGCSSTEREEESEELATTVIRKTRHNSTV